MTATATDKPADTRSCRKCGAAVSGKFCSACGTAAEQLAEEGWSAVLKQVAKGDGSTLLATAMAILREPVAGPVRLALDPTYSGHIKFYLTFVSAAFVAMFVAPQELSRNIFGLDTAGDQSLVKRMMVLQALIVLFLTPLLYYLFRWFSPEQRTPVSFFKASLLVITASNVLIVGLHAIIIAVMLAALLLIPGLPSDAASLQVVYGPLTAVVAIISLIYVVMINVRYWRISWIIPAIVMFCIQIGLEVVTWPIVNALGEGSVGSLFK